MRISDWSSDVCSSDLMGATERLFLDDEGKPLPFFDAVLGGISTGVPGAVAMLDMAHHDHGRLPWAELFKPAGKLVEEGFIVSPRLAGMIALKKAPQASTPEDRKSTRLNSSH